MPFLPPNQQRQSTEGQRTDLALNLSFKCLTAVCVSCVWINIASLFGRFVSIQSRHEMSQTVIPALSSGVTSNSPAPAQISKSNIPSHFPFRSLPPPYPPSFPFYPSPTHPSLLHHALPFPASTSLFPTHSYPVLPSQPLYSGRGSARGAL